MEIAENRPLAESRLRILDLHILWRAIEYKGNSVILSRKNAAPAE